MGKENESRIFNDISYRPNYNIFIGKIGGDFLMPTFHLKC